MSMAMFVAWLLDNHATAPEVAKTLRERNFHISGSTFDGGTVSALHWGITDAEGRTTIVEFVGGDIEVYEGDDIRVLTNDPNWPQMNAINDYWKGIGGVNMLPGTVKSPDRFVRADFFARHVKAVGDTDLGVSICRSVLVNACVPYTYLIEGEPNVSSTQWRSYSDLRDRRYYWDDVTALGIYYIDLNKCDLRPGAPVLKLTTADCKQLAGEANKHLKKVPPFTPQY